MGQDTPPPPPPPRRPPSPTVPPKPEPTDRPRTEAKPDAFGKRSTDAKKIDTTRAAPTATPATDRFAAKPTTQQAVKPDATRFAPKPSTNPQANRFDPKLPVKPGDWPGRGGAGPAGPAGPSRPGQPPPGVRESKGAAGKVGDEFVAGKITDRRTDPKQPLPAQHTTVRASLGEARAYQAALRQGEIGIERPQKVHAGGRADFITVKEGQGGKVTIVVTDVGTTHTGADNKVPTTWDDKLKETPKWDQKLRDAIDPGRLSLGDKNLEQRIRAAYAQHTPENPTIVLRNVKVDYSAQGQGRVEGLGGGVVPGGNAADLAAAAGRAPRATVPGDAPTATTALAGQFAGRVAVLGLGLAAGYLESSMRNDMLNKQAKDAFTKVADQVPAKVGELSQQAAAMKAEAPDKPIYAQVSVAVSTLHVIQSSGEGEGMVSWSYVPVNVSIDPRSVSVSLSHDRIDTPRESNMHIDTKFGQHTTSYTVTWSVPVNVESPPPPRPGNA
jgi:hypothetical protein